MPKPTIRPLTRTSTERGAECRQALFELRGWSVFATTPNATRVGERIQKRIQKRTAPGHVLSGRKLLPRARARVLSSKQALKVPRDLKIGFLDGMRMHGTAFRPHPSLERRFGDEFPGDLVAGVRAASRRLTVSRSCFRGILLREFEPIVVCRAPNRVDTHIVPTHRNSEAGLVGSISGGLDFLVLRLAMERPGRCLQPLGNTGGVPSGACTSVEPGLR